MPRNGLVVHVAVLLVLLLASGAGHGRDRAYGPPWIIELPSAPGAVAVHDRTVAVVEPLAHRLRRATIALGELHAEPTWTVSSAVPDRSAPEALAFPEGVASDAVGNLYVADTGHDRVVLYRPDGSGSYVLDPDFVRDGPPTTDPRPLDLPRDVAVGPGGEVYALDAENRRILVADGPDARRWRVYRADASWDRPAGIDVAPDGAVWLADAGRHRVLRLPPASGDATTEFGRYGDEGANLRRPHDVAVDATGERVYVADTFNHRIAVFSSSGELLRSLGDAPLLGRPTRVAVDPDGRVWTADMGNGWLVAWPGRGGGLVSADAAAAYDGYLRDHRDDTGEEEGGSVPVTSSPDILVRHSPDVDLALAERETLESYGEDLPRYGQSNYLYFEIRNRGDDPLIGSAVGAWTADPGETREFPEDWQRSDFYRQWADGSGEHGNFAEVSFVPPGGRAVAGPLVWRPEEPTDGGSCTDETLLMVRLVDIEDPTRAAGGPEDGRASNNVLVRRLPVVPERCVPPGDRYERNDRIEARAHADPSWEHLGARCPRRITRALGEPYPDTECPGIFENGEAPRGAEEIWRAVVTDLSLHSTADRDFFEIPLPDLRDPRWGLADINPEEVRIRGTDDPDYRPQVMPECGSVQRRDLGPAGRDNRVWLNISTTLTITASPTNGASNDLTERTLDTSGESLRIFHDGEPAPDAATGSPLVKLIACPRDVENLGPVEVSFGERRRSDGSFDRRPLSALGGYELTIAYVTSIDRDIPDWAREHNDGRGIRNVPCLPRPGAFARSRGSAGGGRGLVPSGGHGFQAGAAGIDLFPACSGRRGGPAVIFPGHPRTPKLPGCTADGPGCTELSRFRWTGGHDNVMDVILRTPVHLKIRLLNSTGKVVATARPMEEREWFDRQTRARPNPASGDVVVDRALQKWKPMRLFAQGLKAGEEYYLEVTGPPTEYAMQYWAPPKANNIQQENRGKGNVDIPWVPSNDRAINFPFRILDGRNQ